MRREVPLIAASVMTAGLAVSAYAQDDQNAPQQPPQQSTPHDAWVPPERSRDDGSNEPDDGKLQQDDGNPLQNHQHDGDQTPEKKG